MGSTLGGDAMQPCRDFLCSFVIGIGLLAAVSAGAEPCSSELISAVKKGDSQAILAALNTGATIYCTDVRGYTLLHFVVSEANANDAARQAGASAEVIKLLEKAKPKK